MSRKKIKRKTSKSKPRGRSATRQADIIRKRQPLKNLRLLAKMTRIKQKEAELEAKRTKALEDAARAAADAINAIDDASNEAENAD